MVTVCALLTAATLAVKCAAVEPEATVVPAGTDTELLLLARATLRLFGGAVVRNSVHFVFPAPENELLAHVNARNSGVSTAVAGGEREIETDFVSLP